MCYTSTVSINLFLLSSDLVTMSLCRLFRGGNQAISGLKVRTYSCLYKSTNQPVILYIIMLSLLYYRLNKYVFALSNNF